jgi:hypothetical protein
MRTYIAVVGLIALSACGGGDDVTNPPGSGQFTLTATGSGSGSGRVATSADIQPALDCTVAGNAQASGACTAQYPEGTVVGLTIAPDAGSSFDGWGGDAASCSTAPSCSITMSQNRNVVAQLSGTGSAVQITSSAYYIRPASDPESVVWVVEVRNPTDRVVESARIDFTTRDASGAVLASDFTSAGPIPPGETRAAQSYAESRGNEASVDFRIGEVTFTSADLNLAAAQIVSSDWQADPSLPPGGAVFWSAEVLNTTGNQLESVRIDFATYDSNGRIVAADFAFVDGIPPGESFPAESFAAYRGTEATVKFQVGSVE